MIYLDNGATTLQKPASVVSAMSYAVSHLTSPGRGGYRSADRAAEAAFRCREAASELLGGYGAEQVVFTPGATAALNIALRSLLKPGDHVIISGFEHNAVTRTLEDIGSLKITVLRGDLFCPEEMVEDLKHQLRSDTKAVVLCHVSNVFGYILPVEALSRICRERGVPLVVDAAQSAGSIRVDQREWRAAYVACPGHKGLFGPQGIGLLLCGKDTAPVPLVTGGTGSDSLRPDMPDYLPDRLEAGTLNIPGICGLLAGLEFIRKTGVHQIEAHERRLRYRLVRGLGFLKGLEVFSHPEHQLGVISLRHTERDCGEIAAKLAERGIALRSGFHCAPLAHKTAGTMDTGTLRVSLSAFTTESDINCFLRELKGIL